MNKKLEPEKVDWQKLDGLIPAIVQDADSGVVLMLGFMNREALTRTMELQEVTFYSRSRQALWTKGETSGNKLELVNLELDCDADTVLVMARPTGPVCHRLTPTCFGEASTPSLSFLGHLTQIIKSRRRDVPQDSYTASLLGKPLHRVAQKVGEEAVETVLAATVGDEAELLNEAADLVFHLMVLLEAKGLEITDVTSLLAERHQAAKPNVARPDQDDL